jgi:hypothetical protein
MTYSLPTIDEARSETRNAINSATWQKATIETNGGEEVQLKLLLP